MSGFKLVVVICLAGCLIWTGCPGPGGSGTVSKTDEVSVATAGEGKLSKVIIKEFAATGITPEEVSGISSKFCFEVAKSKKVEAVCADDLKTVLQHKQQQLNFGTCEEEDCLAKMGQMLEADYILQGSLNKVGEVFTVNVNLVTGSTGKVKNRFSQEVSSGKAEDLLDAMVALAAKVRAEF